VWFFHGEASGPSFLQNSPPLVDLGGNFVEEEKEGYVQPFQYLAGDFEVGDLAPKLGGFEEYSYLSGEGNTSGNVEWSDGESDGGDLGDGTSIKHVYRDDIWKQEHFIYDPKSHDLVGESGPNVLWNQFSTMMQLFGLF
jgi:hypothetical protein